MNSDTGDVYIMRGDGDDEWVRPTPARTATVDALREATDLDDASLADIDVDVDGGELAAPRDAGETYTVTVAGYKVVIAPSGDIEITE